MVIICYIGITIDDENDPAPENFPEKQEEQQGIEQQGGEVLKSEGIICPCKVDNVENFSVCLWNYTQEEVLKVSKLKILLVLFPIGYINTIIVSETKKALNDPFYLGEFMRWVGCWLYIGSRLDCVFGTVIRYMVTTIGANLLPFWILYGIPGIGRIVTLHGTLP